MIKYIFSFLVLLISSISAISVVVPPVDPYAIYSPYNVVYYFQSPSQYYRIDYQWHLKNTGQPSITYYNNNYYSADAGGTVDTGYLDAKNLGLFPTNINRIRFAIIDSGINSNHPDFNGLSFSGNTSDLSDASGHGTCVGGVIFAKQNGIGVQGMLQNLSSVIIAKVTYRSTDEISTAIRWCVNQNARIINLAWGTSENNAGLSNAVLFAKQNGAIIVCAAPDANQNVNTSPDYPSSWRFDNVISVTSITRTGTKYSPAAWGPTTVHLGAPGRVIVTTGLNPLYVYNSGTSMATPSVTSALVLIANKYPYQPYQYWIERLLVGVIPETDLGSNTISGGRLNLVSPLRDDSAKLTFSYNNQLQTMNITVVSGFNSGVYFLQSCTNLASPQHWDMVKLIGNNESYGFHPDNPMMFFQVKLLDCYIPQAPQGKKPKLDIWCK